jgi:transcriptional regulator with XRE-family HTH domain
MTTLNRISKLIREFRDKEYRHASVASHITNRIAFQIRALREQRQWNQERLAQEAGMKQERISVLENPNHSSVNIETLKRLARAFDVALIVGFVPFSHLVKWELDLSSNSLEVPSFDQEPYFTELPREGLTTTSVAQTIVTEGMISAYTVVTVPWNSAPNIIYNCQQNAQGIAVFNPIAGGSVGLGTGGSAAVINLFRPKESLAQSMPQLGDQGQSDLTRQRRAML